MALILDPVTGKAAGVNQAGSILTAPGGDGFPTYVTRFGSVLLPAAAAGTYLWAIRAPATRTIDIRYAVLRLGQPGVLTAAATQSAVEFVKFSGADPAGGQVLVPERKNINEGAAQTTVIREATTTLVTLTGATVAQATQGFGTLFAATLAGASNESAYPDMNGMLLAPGEGLAVRVVLAVPAAATLGGFLEFSERP